MVEEINDLINKIEYLRRQLEKIVYEKGTTYDAEVLAVSQCLDRAINDYYHTVAQYVVNTR